MLTNGSKCRGIAIVVTALISATTGLGSRPQTAAAQPPAAVVAEVSEQADGRLAAILEGHAADVGRLETRVRAARGKLLAETIDRLQKLQDEHCRAARLDEALAVREAIRRLEREAGLVAAALSTGATPGPDSLTGMATKVGDTRLFTVTGANRGIVWGTDVYTIDSNLAAAAVHAGALAIGETGVVKVTIVESPMEHAGSLRHEIMSHRWPRYRMSFRVERVGPVRPAVGAVPPPPTVVAPEPGLPPALPSLVLPPSPDDRLLVTPPPGVQPPTEAGARSSSGERATPRRPFD